MKKATFGLLITTRGFFNPLLAQEGRRRIIEKLVSMGHEVVALSTNDTNYGAVETYEDAKKCAQLFRENRDKINGIIISIPNFGDEGGTAEAIRMAQLSVPILIHAFDDDINSMDLDNRRDSFCGKLSICANLNQYGVKFTNTSLHTCDIDSLSFKEDIEYFNSICNVVNGIKGARIAQIGTRPAAFRTVRYSEKLLEQSGISIIPVDLSEIIKYASSMENSPMISERLDEIHQYGRIPSGIPEENIKKSAKLRIAIENFMTQNECSAGAVQCWDSIQQNYGCATCLPMSMINEGGKAMACETDITGAITMLALSFASGKPSAYMDWNNNYGDDREKCVLIHCANYPKSFFGTEFEISNLDILGASLGYDKCFGALKGKVAAGDFSFAKMTTDDTNGVIKCYLGQGKFTDDPIETKGAPVVARVPNLQKLMDHICMNGYEHHVAVNKSLSANVLKEAFEKYLNWKVYAHE